VKRGKRWTEQHLHPIHKKKEWGGGSLAVGRKGKEELNFGRGEQKRALLISSRGKEGLLIILNDEPGGREIKKGGASSRLRKEKGVYHLQWTKRAISSDHRKKKRKGEKRKSYQGGKES